ncbi:hypothetical protein JCM10212_002102 [Sporobolomyces blumeae]
MVSVNNPVLPKGSLILVTGANGFIASHVIEVLLSSGYKVRGTSRSAAKLDNLKKRWEEKFPGQFEVAEVPDILKEGAYDEAIKGVAGVAHVASNVSFSPKYDEVVRDAVEGTLEALRAAHKTPSVKRFVLTSSIVAVGQPGPDAHYAADHFHYDAIKAAKATPDDAPEKGGLVYAASKTEGELAAWKFVQENKPSFTFNAVLPAFTLGEILDDKSQSGSTAGMLKTIFLKQSDAIMKSFGGVEFTSVRDVAVLHLAGLVEPSISNARLISSPHPSSWNEVLAIFRKLYPNRDFYPDTDSGETEPNSRSYDLTASEDALHKVGQQDWVPLEDCIKENVAPFAEA